MHTNHPFKTYTLKAYARSTSRLKRTKKKNCSEDIKKAKTKKGYVTWVILGMVSPARDSRPASPLRNVSPIRRRPKDQNSTCKLRKFRRARIEVAECVGKVSLSFFFFFFFFFFALRSLNALARCL